MLEGHDLFQRMRTSDGDHDVRAHFAEMIALLGPPPSELFDQERQRSDVNFSHNVPNTRVHLQQKLGAPLFNPDGESIIILACTTLLILYIRCVYSRKPDPD